MATKYRTDNYPYKVYTALLTQSGTQNPSANVYENTTGQSINFTRTSVGNYECVLGSAPFGTDNNKLFITVSTSSNVTSLSGYDFNYTSPNNVIIYNTQNLAGSFTDGGKVLIEIRVYN